MMRDIMAGSQQLPPKDGPALAPNSNARSAPCCKKSWIIIPVCQNNGGPDMMDRRRRPEMTDR